jgi:ectoine hydroxylase-related dioxygenase (phytanoyl-CoA dioxygenase family)
VKTELSQEQIDFYRDNGYLILHDFLTADELATWRDALDSAIRQRGKQLIPGHDWSVDEDSYYSKVFVQRVNLWQDSAPIRQLIWDGRLGRLAAELAGVEGMRLWHDQALIKQPWANPTGWHLDNPFWSWFSRDAISLWVALDDVTIQNGCLYFLPGTHKTARYDNSGIGENLSDIFKIYPEWAKIHAVPAEMKAGSCSFHNGLIAHGAGPNMTPGWRRAMTCGFMPDGSTFNGQRNILTKERLAKLTVGAVLDDDEYNPLLYHKSKPSLYSQQVQ